MITAEIQTPQIEHSQSPEAKHELEQLLTLTDRYYAPSTVVPDVAKECGVDLNFELSATLMGEGMVGDENIAGLGRASRAVGEVINGWQQPYQLFDKSSVRTEESVIIDPDDQSEYTDINYLPPEKEKLEALVSNRSISSQGRLLSRLMLDASYPYEIQKGDGYVDLEPREPSRAKIFRGSYDNADGEATAKLCSNTENHFAYDIPNGILGLSVDGEVVAVRKHSGNHTAILIKPAVLNGVRLPVGTVMIPEGNEEEGYKFGFGRLSMFVAEDGAEAIREFPNIAHRENFHSKRGSRALDASMNEFKELCGDVGHDPHDLIDEYMSKQGADGVRVTWKSAVATISEEIRGKLDESESVHIVKMLGALRKKATEAAKVSIVDKDAVLAEGFDADPKNRTKVIDSVRHARLRIHKTFGADRVAEVENLLNLQAFLENAAA